MTTLRLFLLLVLTPLFGSSQFVEEHTIPGDFDSMEFDNLFNTYGIKGAEIVKFNSEGVQSFQFSDRQTGEIGNLDVTFPLRPLVLYPNLNYVILLDNTLSNNRGRINLTEKNLSLMTTGCSSVQNHFWFYDAMNFSLVRFNENFKQVATTGNLAQVLRMELDPNFTIEFANRVYLNDPKQGILVFDIFGTYIKTIPLKGLSEFNVNERGISYFKSGNIYLYDPISFSEQMIELPVECQEAFIWENRVAALCDGSIKVWEVVQP